MKAEQITALREEMKVTRRKFAGLMGVTPRTVRNWESGCKLPRSAAIVLAQLATVFRPAAKSEGGK